MVKFYKHPKNGQISQEFQNIIICEALSILWAKFHKHSKNIVKFSQEFQEDSKISQASQKYGNISQEFQKYGKISQESQKYRVLV